MYLDKMNNTNPIENMSEIRCSSMKFLLYWCSPRFLCRLTAFMDLL